MTRSSQLTGNERQRDQPTVWLLRNASEPVKSNNGWTIRDKKGHFHYILIMILNPSLLDSSGAKAVRRTTTSPRHLLPQFTFQLVPIRLIRKEVNLLPCKHSHTHHILYLWPRGPSRTFFFPSNSFFLFSLFCLLPTSHHPRCYSSSHRCIWPVPNPAGPFPSGSYYTILIIKTAVSKPVDGERVPPMSHKRQVLHQRKGRSLDKDAERAGSPIQGSFVPVSPNRTRSLSPRKHIPRQSVHINMNLTEYQMDRLADANPLLLLFSNYGNTPNRRSAATDDRDSADHSSYKSSRQSRSTAGRSNQVQAANGKKTSSSRSRIPVPADLGGFEQLRDDESLELATRGSISTTFSDLIPRSQGQGQGQGQTEAASSSTTADDARQYSTYTSVYRSHAIPAVSHPLTPDRPLLQPMEEENDTFSSSFYSQSEHQPATTHAGSLLPQNGSVSQQLDDAIQTCNQWKGAKTPPTSAHGQSVRPGSPVRNPSPDRNRSPVRERANVRGNPVAQGSKFDTLRQPELDTNAYSPLMTYFAFEGLPVQKIGGKTLIGEQGWLERPGPANTTTTAAPGINKQKAASPKKAGLGLLDSIKKMAREMVSFICPSPLTESKTSRRSREPDKESKRSSSRMTISLDPREQSLLYCELEFHVSNALHAYITNELNHGRLDPDKLKRVADSWAGKGRPKVVGFRYDLETQLDLVHLHLDDFRFFGRRQGNPLEIAGLLHAMKVNARAMRIRTFCQPDSVIAKQLVDAQSLFNTIGCSDQQLVALAEVAQFFKVIVERELHYRERLAASGSMAAEGTLAPAPARATAKMTMLPPSSPSRRQGRKDRQWEPARRQGDLPEGRDRSW
ncbi:hypothetical protein ACRALDRAFT_2019539 [Sodiomyces alcalophilus JCM 7366]|uniref:uncharacterized protein n=1 Tax=Sodiomyces alcalophilus JCM 7366 TaxID=591952 RepID=UPI0039B4640B